jgi:hypothetical protein
MRKGAEEKREEFFLFVRCQSGKKDTILHPSG